MKINSLVFDKKWEHHPPNAKEQTPTTQQIIGSKTWKLSNERPAKFIRFFRNGLIKRSFCKTVYHRDRSKTALYK